jgi:O-antigen/teichoic acid export membrane protein
MSKSAVNNKRIAKNTLLLYLRMLFLMCISLYTSRVILQTLGVQDFGIYNVVGSFVALFAVVSKSLSAAASRFLNFEMGKCNAERLSKVFSTTLIIHILLALIIAIMAEVIGVWFVNNKMVVPHDRLYAANWAFQISILTFCVNLITVPFNAAIIAHERMKIFAIIGIYEGIAKLLICYLLLVSPIDRLIFYAFLFLFTQIGVMAANVLFCRKNFDESRARFVYDKSLIKEIFGFASWNMIGASSNILRNQGGNILLNMFFGPLVNAARAVANQVLHAVEGFVGNFMTALNPQITQTYASGEHDRMMTLIYSGARFSFYMLFALCLPIIVNTDYLLHIWLSTVPEHSVLFVQLTLIYCMIESISRPLVTAQLATGNIRNYQLLVGGLQLLNLPIDYILLSLNYPPEVILYVAISLSVCMLVARLYMLRGMIHLDACGFIRKVLINIFVTSLSAMLIPLLLAYILPTTFVTFVIKIMSCLLFAGLSVFFVGLSIHERKMCISKIKQIHLEKLLKL